MGTFFFAKLGESATIIFNEDGTYFGPMDPGPGIRGTYVIEGNQITLVDDSGACGGSPGTYEWDFDGQLITFRLIADECTSRIDPMVLGGGLKRND